MAIMTDTSISLLDVSSINLTAAYFLKSSSWWTLLRAWQYILAPTTTLSIENHGRRVTSSENITIRMDSELLISCTKRFRAFIKGDHFVEKERVLHRLWNLILVVDFVIEKNEGIFVLLMLGNNLHIWIMKGWGLGAVSWLLYLLHQELIFSWKKFVILQKKKQRKVCVCRINHDNDVIGWKGLNRKSQEWIGFYNEAQKWIKHERAQQQIRSIKRDQKIKYKDGEGSKTKRAWQQSTHKNWEGLITKRMDGEGLMTKHKEEWAWQQSTNMERIQIQSMHKDGEGLIKKLSTEAWQSISITKQQQS